jgi:hypothetical protein
MAEIENVSGEKACAEGRSLKKLTETTTIPVRNAMLHRPRGTLRSSLASAVYSRSGSPWLLMM